ncbi:RNA polymerase sigma-70 factor [Rudanella lutea]|uniref:RNA polymerase sigma-70 factor n=1 Tax=Rudanella lutea TaxID=451374 RepID=UPI00035F48DE|nr:RNA polymerase sigma-70 factor [Rudanella lutea]
MKPFLNQVELLSLKVDQDNRTEEFSEWVDKELFLRNAFAQEPSRGCELLFRAYYRELCSHAARFVYSRQIAEDIVGEVFLRFYEREHYKNISSSFRAYLFRAVRNLALNHLRYEVGQFEQVNNLTMNDIYSESEDPDHILQMDELNRKINETVKHLPQQAQRVFILSRFEGRTHAEICTELNIQPKTVESHVTKALQALRKALKQGWLSLLFFLSSIG